jgi:hypothetical protein
MKKIITNLFLCLLFLIAEPTQAQIFQKDKNFINVGYGFGSYTRGLGNAYASQTGYTRHAFGPVSVSFEHGIKNNISLGGFVGYYRSGVSWNTAAYPTLNIPSYEYKYTWSGLQILFRGAYHYDFKVEKLDTYGGLGIGYTNWSYKWESTEPSFNSTNYIIKGGSPIGLSAFVGARYMFSEQVGGYLEGGWGLSAVQLGLTFKL